jgi:antitoxin ParD1/3/4
MAKTTSVNLGDHFESFVAQQVESGRYSTASEVLRDALRLLERRRKREAYIAQALDEGLASGISPLSHEEIWQGIMSKYRQKDGQ